MLQDRYSNRDYSYLGMSNTAWSVSGRFLLARRDISGQKSDAEMIEELLAHSKDDVRNEFNKYLTSGLGKNLNKSHFVILDIEGVLGASAIGTLSEYLNDSDLQQQAIQALKMRLEVAREFLPSSKIFLWSTPNPPRFGDPNHQGFQNQMAGHQLLSQAGVYDLVDYLLPTPYVLFLPGDPNYETFEGRTREGIRAAKQIKRKNGSSIPIAVVLATHAAHGYNAVEHWVGSRQIEIIHQEGGVSSIMYWLGGVDDQYGFNQKQWFESVKPVPAGCFCTSAGMFDENKRRTYLAEVKSFFSGITDSLRNFFSKLFLGF